MEFHAITREYYAKWLCVAPHLLDETGIFAVYNAARNEQLVGYPKALDVLH